MTRQTIDQQAADARTRWAEVRQWSGGFSSEQTHEVFDAPDGTWRLTYKTEPGEPGKNGVVDIILKTKAGRMASSAYNLQGEVSGVLKAMVDAAQYLLEVKSFGPRWRVAVERLE